MVSFPPVSPPRLPTVLLGENIVVFDCMCNTQKKSLLLNQHNGDALQITTAEDSSRTSVNITNSRLTTSTDTITVNALTPPNTVRLLSRYSFQEGIYPAWEQKPNDPEGIRSRLQFKCDGTRWRNGGEVKGKLANGVGSQYPSHYLGTWCIQHYYRWCEHLGCQ